MELVLQDLVQELVGEGALAETERDGGEVAVAALEGSGVMVHINHE